MTGITVLKSNVPHGPFNRAEIAEKLLSGEITPESLAFIEGLTQWTPLRDVLAQVDATPSPHAPIGTGFGMETQMASSTAPVSAGAGYSYAATMAPPDHFIYAGFWIRAAAVIIDGFITLPFSFPYYGFTFASKYVENTGAKTLMLLGMIASWFGLVIGRWLYFALLESGAQQATFGKRLLGIYVADRQGQRISFGRATGRYFGKIISGLALFIGFMMAGWTARKQALHDMIADTLVVRK